MKTIELQIGYTTKPQSLVGVLKQENLQRGDRIAISSSLEEEMTLLIILVALSVFDQQKFSYPEKVLKNIFDNKASGEIEKEIAAEYGIAVEVNIRKEEKEWQQFSKQKLARAYSNDEAEYNASMLKEPNPNFKG